MLSNPRSLITVVQMDISVGMRTFPPAATVEQERLIQK